MEVSDDGRIGHRRADTRPEGAVAVRTRRKPARARRRTGAADGPHEAARRLRRDRGVARRRRRARPARAERIERPRRAAGHAPGSRRLLSAAADGRQPPQVARARARQLYAERRHAARAGGEGLCEQLLRPRRDDRHHDADVLRRHDRARGSRAGALRARLLALLQPQQGRAHGSAARRDR